MKGTGDPATGRFEGRQRDVHDLEAEIDRVRPPLNRGAEYRAPVDPAAGHEPRQFTAGEKAADLLVHDHPQCGLGLGGSLEQVDQVTNAIFNHDLGLQNRQSSTAGRGGQNGRVILFADLLQAVVASPPEQGVAVDLPVAKIARDRELKHPARQVGFRRLDRPRQLEADAGATRRAAKRAPAKHHRLLVGPHHDQATECQEDGCPEE